MTAGAEGANTSQASPLRIRPASSLDTPDVRRRLTPAFLASKACFNSRIGPASESACMTSMSEAMAPLMARTVAAATLKRNRPRRTADSSGCCISPSAVAGTPPRM